MKNLLVLGVTYLLLIACVGDDEELRKPRSQQNF